MLAREFPTSCDEHDYHINDDAMYECSRCGHTVKRLGNGGTCIGVRIYHTWDSIPDTMTTKTQLGKEHKKKLAKGQVPVGAKKKYNHRGKFTGHYYALYAIADAVDKKPATEAQKEALKKARYMAEKRVVVCSRCGDPEWGKYDVKKVTRKQWIEKDYDNFICEHCNVQKRATQWAKELIESNDFVILDTETSDLDGEIIEISVIDAQGNVLLDQRIKPQGDINPDAEFIHGISLDDLANEPTFPEVYEQIKAIISGRTVAIYNAGFDDARLMLDCDRHELERIEYQSECVMLMYAQWYGQYSNYWDDYKWQPLRGGDHSALGDCQATLARLHEMAGD